ncbi:MAG TPA: cytochrome c [Humisphaera sp.]|nr:cytochrome c [Humisphaera sp.]
MARARFNIFTPTYWSLVLLVVSFHSLQPAASAAPADILHPTFSADIASLVYSNCAVCHREGEAAPFSLLSYRDVQKHARQIVELTSRKVMPPWKPDAASPHFIGERRLSDGQIEMLKRWVDQGCAEGNPAAEPQPPKFTAGWQLGEPDMTVSMADMYTLAAEGRDVYRCFVIPVHIPAGKYLKAVEYRPQLRKIVHHAVLTTMSERDAQKRLDAEPAGTGPGFSSGLAAPGDRLPGPLGIWVPGKDVLPLPRGYAFRWPGSQVLVLQLHLHPDGKVEQERSTVGLYFTDEKPRGAVQVVLLFNKEVNIAPGEKEFTLRASQTLKYDADVVGLFPHMHLLGRTVTLTATLPDGATAPVLSISDWDFNWQGYYQPAAPLHLPAGTRLDCVWTFDNSPQNPANPSNPPKRVRFGEQTTNEMGAMIMDVIATSK